MMKFSKFLSFAITIFLAIFITSACSAANLNNTIGSMLNTAPSVSTEPPLSTPPVVPESNYVTVYQLGEPLNLELAAVQTELLGSTLEYSWARHDGRIFIKQHEERFPLGIIYGSDRYIYASSSNMTGVYHYLIDVETGTVLDPLEALDSSIRERISDVLFSSTGSHALICHHSSTSAVLLDCSTGHTVPLSVAEDVYSVFGFFADDSHILLASCFQNAQGEFHYTFARYNILTGETVSIPGEYQKADKSKDNFIHFSDGGILYTFADGQLTIIDPLTWEMTAYPFPDDATVSYYTTDTYIVSANGNRYLLHKNGTYQQIDDI